MPVQLYWVRPDQLIEDSPGARATAEMEVWDPPLAAVVVVAGSLAELKQKAAEREPAAPPWPGQQWVPKGRTKASYCEIVQVGTPHPTDVFVRYVYPTGRTREGHMSLRTLRKDWRLRSDA